MDNSEIAIELREAVENSDVARVIRILKCHPSLANSLDCGKSTPLHTAASIGDSRMISALLENGADATAQNFFGATPLHKVARTNSSDSTLLLLQAGADVHARDRFENTPLHHAAESGSDRVAALLIESGADLERRNDRGRSPLSFCIAGNPAKEAIAAQLLASGAALDLNSAVRLGKASLVRDLLTANQGEIQMCPFPNDLLVDAIMIESEDIVSLLLDNGVKVNGIGTYECTALSFAVRANSATSIVSHLLDHGADLNARDYPLGGLTPLEMARRNNNERLVKLLQSVE
jgi:ankyrin repeat protein